MAQPPLLPASGRYPALTVLPDATVAEFDARYTAGADYVIVPAMTREYFKTFTAKPIADTHRTCAVLLALSHDTREQVDAIAKGAAAAGGKTDVREGMDTGWLYNRAIEDPDGHILELVWMDVAAMASAEAEHA